MANPVVLVKFLSDTSDLAKGFDDVGAKTKGLGMNMKTLGKAALVAGGAAGLAALGAGLKTGIDELTEASKVGAQTNAVIKSTGEAAGVSAKHVSDLAGALMEKSGMDDEAIQSGENMLLTFTNIRNEAGKGNDVFDQTTKIMADMSVALGQDMTQSAMQLGKALNDPVKGMTALRRVGVTFTAQQQAQVKAMVAAGDTMGAQKLILAELNREFGGSAEALGKTLPGQINILKESFSNLAGSMVQTLVPAFKAITNFLVEHPGLFKAIVAAVFAFSAALVALNAVMVVTAAVGAIGFWWVFAIVAGIAALIAIIVLLAKHWDEISAAFVAAWEWVKNAATAAWDAMVSAFKSALDWVKANWPTLLVALLAPFAPFAAAVAALVIVVIKHWDDIKQAISAAWDAIKAATSAALNAIQSAVTAVWSAISASVTSIVNAIKTTVTAAWDAIKTSVTAVLNALQATATAVWNAIKGVVTGAVSGIQAAVADVVAAFKKPGDAAETMLGAVKSAFGALAGAITAVVGAVSAAAEKVAHAITAPIDAAKSAVNAVLGKFNALSIPGFTVSIPMPGPVPDIHFGWGGMPLPDIPLLAKGGILTSPTLFVGGEGPGREIVTPEALLRSIVGEQTPDVRVYIGETELRGMVRVEVRNENNRTAQTLLAGLT